MDGSKPLAAGDDSQSSSPQLEFDGERFIPGGPESEIDLEHYHRYLAASEVVHGKRVLDMACGAGYGSHILSKTALEVVGLDISREAIAFASSRFISPNLRYMHGDCTSPPFEDASFDVIVSFETLEHITDQDAFLDACRRLLKPAGVLIISTPDRERYNAQLARPNEHHVKELSEREFSRALKSRFKNVRMAGQRVVFGSLIVPARAAAKFESIRQKPEGLDAASAYDRSIYLLAHCSQETPPALPAGLYEGAFPPNAVSSLIGGIRERDDEIVTLRQQLEATHSQAPKVQASGWVTDGALTRELEAQTAIIASLRTRISWIDEELSRVSAAKEHAEALLRGANAELIGRREEARRLQEQVRSAAEVETNLTAELTLRAEAITRLEGELSGQIEAVAAVSRELSALRSQIRVLEHERDELVRDNVRIREDFKQDQGRLETMIARAASAEAWLDSERRRVSVLESRVLEAEQAAEQLRTLLRAAEMTATKANGESADLRARIGAVDRLANDRGAAVDLATQEGGGIRPSAGALSPIERLPNQRRESDHDIDLSVSQDASALVRQRRETGRMYQQLQNVLGLLATEREDLQRTLQERQLAETALRRERFIGKRVVSGVWRKVRRIPELAVPVDFLAFVKNVGVLRLGSALRMARDAYVLRKNRAVDEMDYTARYFDLRILGVDPVRHYLLYGAAEGRDPRRDFSTSGYLAANPDVRESKINPLVHHVRYGKTENRQFHWSSAHRAGQPPPPTFRQGVDATPAAEDGRLPSSAAPDLYSVRPDDVVASEAQHGRTFLRQFRLLSQSPDFEGAIEALISARAPVRDGVAQPDVSIVIPIYGQLAYTLNCLDSLSRHSSKYRFEIIVVDDRSPDESYTYLKRLPWIQLLQNSQNQGFLRTCNIAAEKARGDHIILLNNDTRVVEGWLDEMIDSFDRFPSAGLVGSKMFYEDGSLQEAGGIIWRDGSAWNFGRNDDPAKPEYCFARRVDYVSGCSIGLPTKTWRALGGFDERYMPAYCEDADLAMRVRESGLEVWMQPLSRVIHYEGKTSGTDTSGGVKAYQVKNTKKLFERWGERLSTHGASGQDPQRESNRTQPKRALLIDSVTPTPEMDAGSVTTSMTLQILHSLGYAPTFVPVDNFLFYPPHTPALHRAGIQTAYVPFDMSFEDHVRRHGRSYDIIIVYRIGVLQKVLPHIRRYAPQAPLAFHNIDIHFLRLERQAALTGDNKLIEQAKQMKESELRVLREVDCTIVHSEVEQAILKAAAQDADIVVFPYMTELVGTKVPFEARRDIMFLGGYSHSPNEDAVLHFVRESWPALRRSMPGAKFFAVGSNPTDAMRALAADDVIITGQVPDLQPYFDRCRVFVCPLRFGAGVKGKISTSMAHGLPVVSTSIGTEGMGLLLGRDVIVADVEQEFREAVRLVYSDKSKWDSLSQAGLTFVSDNNSYGMGVRKVGEVIEAARRQHARRSQHD